MADGYTSSNLTDAAKVMLNTEPAKVYFRTALINNQAFIEDIYLNTLSKTYAEDPEGVNYWVGELNGVNGGKSKREVIAQPLVTQHPDNAGQHRSDPWNMLCNKR